MTKDLDQDIDHLVNEVAKRVDEMIDSTNVVGEKIVVGDTTIIPLMAAGFAGLFTNVRPAQTWRSESSMPTLGSST